MQLFYLSEPKLHSCFRQSDVFPCASWHVSLYLCWVNLPMVTYTNPMSREIVGTAVRLSTRQNNLMVWYYSSGSKLTGKCNKSPVLTGIYRQNTVNVDSSRLSVHGVSRQCASHRQLSFQQWEQCVAWFPPVIICSRVRQNIRCVRMTAPSAPGVRQK